MWPDLGKYTVTITSAYAVTILLTAAIIAVSLWRARKTKAQLAVLEARRHEK